MKSVYCLLVYKISYQNFLTKWKNMRYMFIDFKVCHFMLIFLKNVESNINLMFLYLYFRLLS